MKKPELELKNVKFSEFASEETNCYQATLYVDGKKFCIVGNDGYGGPDYQRRATFDKDGENIWDAINELDERIKKTFPKWKCQFDGSENETTLEIACGDLLSEYLVKRDLKSLLRRKVVSIGPDGKCYTWNAKPTKQALSIIPKNNPTHKFLNVADFAEALSLYRQAA